MNPVSFTRNLQLVTRDPILRSGLKLAKNVRLLEAMRGLQGPQKVATLAKQARIKERYAWELVQSLHAAGLVDMSDSGISIPQGCENKLIEAANEVNFHSDLAKVVPTLEKCYTLEGPDGYTVDDAPFVMQMVNKMRIHQVIATGIKNAIIKYKGQNVKTLLDVGCGNGAITNPLALMCPGIELTGCDISALSIYQAQATSIGVPNATYVHVDGKTYPKDWQKKFDVVLIFDVLHDLQQPEPFIRKVKDVAKDDGILIIVDPKVSSNPSQNRLNTSAAKALTISSFYCVAASSCNHGAGLGISWGEQNKERFLNQAGLLVKHKVLLTRGDFDYAFICVKKK